MFLSVFFGKNKPIFLQPSCKGQIQKQILIQLLTKSHKYMTKPNKRLLKQKNAENSLIRHLGVLETKMHNYATKTGVFLLLMT